MKVFYRGRELLLSTIRAWFADAGIKRWTVEKKQKFSRYGKYCLFFVIPMSLSVLCFYGFPSEIRGRWAAFFLCCILLFLVGLMVIVKQEVDFSLQMQQLKTSMLERQYQQLLAADKNRMILVHDTKNHMRTIGAMLEQERTKDAAAYVAQIVGKLAVGETTFWSNHETLDLVLNTKIQEARNAQIRVDCHCDDMSGLSLSFVEVCALFSNLLDNAIEAAGQCPTEKRWINLQCARRERMLMVSVSNSVQAEKKNLGNQFFRTAKADKELHGFGMHSIQNVLDRHGGEMRVHEKEGEICIVVYLAAFGEKEVSDKI